MRGHGNLTSAPLSRGGSDPKTPAGMIRAVRDSNVIVSGFIRQEGAPGQLLKAALEAGRFTLVTSPFVLREVAETLWEEKIRKYHQWNRGHLLAFVARLHRQSQVTLIPPALPLPCRLSRSGKTVTCKATKAATSPMAPPSGRYDGPESEAGAPRFERLAR